MTAVMTQKRVVIQFRVTAKEKRAIQRDARRWKMSLSQFVRSRLRPAPPSNLGETVAAAWEKAIKERSA